MTREKVSPGEWYLNRSLREVRKQTASVLERGAFLAGIQKVQRHWGSTVLAVREDQLGGQWGAEKGEGEGEGTQKGNLYEKIYFAEH